MKHADGFTLIEIAMAVFVITLLLSSILVPLGTQINQRKTSDTQKALNEIKESLIGFALVNGYLPCPAESATNGEEDRTGPDCTGGKRQGLLPWATLGTPKTDSWGNIFRYSVTPAFASSASPFSFSTPTDITVQTRTATGIVNVTNLNGVPAVVLSHGKNGYGAFNDQGDALAPPPASHLDESINATNATTFVSRVTQEAGAAGTGGEFDDIVVWLSPNILFNRMVAAGRLP